MKTKIICMASAALLWSGVAAADPYESCQDAYNYGYNMAQFYVSAIYNKADCGRVLASRYEDYVFDIIPTYWAAESKTTTPENAACMLQGSFAGWMDTTEDEYLVDCAGVPGFETIQRKLLAMVAGPLFSAFYFRAPDYYTADIVATSFAYDFSTWPLGGTPFECSAQIDVETTGVPWELVGALKATVCTVSGLDS